jgi:predicted small secreted protein
MMSRLLFIGMLTGLMLSSTACNTMRGIGQDIQKGGQAIQRAAS